jgi:hypothetical protein
MHPHLSTCVQTVMKLFIDFQLLAIAWLNIELVIIKLLITFLPTVVLGTFHFSMQLLFHKARYPTPLARETSQKEWH